MQNEGDHYRTRLTHSIEVSQIARALARGLGLDDDLAETLALAHDLGHTPFGHTGEDARSACLKDFGGFDHNAHALRIVTELEHRYATFNGLNLTWETLEGLVKHNGPLLDASGAPLSPHKTVAAASLEFDRQYPLDLSSHASLEAQCAALADDIAYNTHDIDDGLRAGLFSLDDLRQVPLLHELLEEIAQLHPGLSTARAIHELGRRVITRFVEDALTESKRRIARKAPQNVDEVRQAGETLIGFSTEFVAADKDIKGFLYPKMYRHERVMRIRAKAEHVLRQLFVLYMNSPEHLPAEWIKSEANEAELAAIVGDYIAGMTDRFALREYQRHFDLSYELG